MGFSASNLSYRLRKINYRTIRILEHEDSKIKWIQHTDNIKHPYNHCNYYEHTGYNSFRRNQKHKKSKRKRK